MMMPGPTLIIIKSFRETSLAWQNSRLAGQSTFWESFSSNLTVKYLEEITRG